MPTINNIVIGTGKLVCKTLLVINNYYYRIGTHMLVNTQLITVFKRYIQIIHYTLCRT